MQITLTDLCQRFINGEITTFELVTECNRLREQPTQESQIRFWEEQVVKYYGYTIEHIYHKTRINEIVLLRKIVCYILLKYTSLNARQIAKRYGLTFASVYHFNKAAESEIEYYPAFRAEMETILNECGIK